MKPTTSPTSTPTEVPTINEANVVLYVYEMSTRRRRDEKKTYDDIVDKVAQDQDTSDLNKYDWIEQSSLKRLNETAIDGYKEEFECDNCDVKSMFIDESDESIYVELSISDVGTSSVARRSVSQRTTGTVCVDFEDGEQAIPRCDNPTCRSQALANGTDFAGLTTQGFFAGEHCWDVVECDFQYNVTTFAERSLSRVERFCTPSTTSDDSDVLLYAILIPVGIIVVGILIGIYLHNRQTVTRVSFQLP